MRKVTLVTLQLNKQTAVVYVCDNKSMAEDFLLVQATKNWSQTLKTRIMPKTKKEVMTAFYSRDTGNSFSLTNGMLVDNKDTKRQVQAATNRIKRTKVTPVKVTTVKDKK